VLGDAAPVVALLLLAGEEAEADPAADEVLELDPELHPTMRAAIAAIATPAVAIRARLRENMVLAAPLQERPMARQYIAVMLVERSGWITIQQVADQATCVSVMFRNIGMDTLR